MLENSAKAWNRTATAATSSAAPTPEPSWAAMRPLCSASGAKNGARPSRRALPAIFSSSWGSRLNP